MAMVGVQPVALPRIVAEHDLAGAARESTAATSPRVDQIAVELAVDVAEEDDDPGIDAAQSPRRLALLVLALCDERDACRRRRFHVPFDPSVQMR